MFDIGIGLDLATSASIIGASFAYIRSERMRRESEKKWREELAQKGKIDLSQSLVNDVLAFVPKIVSAGERVRDSLDGLGVTLADGAQLITPEAAALAINSEFRRLREQLEFELLRTLEIKIAFMDGQGVWDREAAKCMERIAVVETAMKGVVAACQASEHSAQEKLVFLGQVLPLMLASEPIGGKYESVYTAVIKLAHDLKRGLLDEARRT